MDRGSFLVDPAVEQIHVPQKVVDEGRERVVVDVVGRADLLDAAFIHHHHAVGHLQRLFLIVGDKHAGDVNFVVQLPQPAAQFQADLRVQRAERLVQQQDAGLDRQGARQGDPLPLAAGKLGGIPVGQTLQAGSASAVRAPWRGSRSLEGRTRRGRTRNPNAIFSNTVMCRNSA